MGFEIAVQFMLLLGLLAIGLQVEAATVHHDIDVELVLENQGEEESVDEHFSVVLSRVAPSFLRQEFLPVESVEAVLESRPSHRLRVARADERSPKTVEGPKPLAVLCRELCHPDGLPDVVLLEHESATLIAKLRAGSPIESIRRYARVLWPVSKLVSLDWLDDLGHESRPSRRDLIRLEALSLALLKDF